MKKYRFKARSASIILLSAGYEWAGGHYIPSDAPTIAYLFQFVVISILLIIGIKFTGLTEEQRQKPNWSVRGFTIFSSLSLLTNIANVIHGAYNADTNSYGSHNTFADLVPIGIIIAGALLWLSTIAGNNRSDNKNAGNKRSGNKHDGNKIAQTQPAGK